MLTVLRWSPLHELVPDVPLRHGHAISIDMAYSATLANLRGVLSDADRKRIHDLFSRAGLSMDHHQFDEEILDQGTKAILKTRDGKLRAAVPSPLGSCIFLNDVSAEEMFAALKEHKKLMKSYPRKGEGLEAFVDAGDTGYTLNDKPVEANGHANGATNGATNGLKKLTVLNDDTKANGNGMHLNGHTNGAAQAEKHASGPKGVDGIQNGNGAPAGVNGHANGRSQHGH